MFPVEDKNEGKYYVMSSHASQTRTGTTVLPPPDFRPQPPRRDNEEITDKTHLKRQVL